MLTFILGIGMIALTLAIYIPATRLYRRMRWPILMPVLTTTAVIVLILLISDIKLDTYMLGGKWIQELLGPAVVSLAFPLAKHLDVLKQNMIPILGGTLGGSVVGMSTGAAISLLLVIRKISLLHYCPNPSLHPLPFNLLIRWEGIHRSLHYL
nr:LrgB family protein [Paenibacillus pabuli]